MTTPNINSSLKDEEYSSSEFELLRRFVLYHVGRFTLGFVRVNHPAQRDELIASLTQVLQEDHVQLMIVDLSNRRPASLRYAIKGEPQGQSISEEEAEYLNRTALAIVGMEHLLEIEAGIDGRPPFAAALNLERDILPVEFPLPILIFLTDHSMDRLNQFAPDFFDWYSGVFRFRPPQPLLEHRESPAMERPSIDLPESPSLSPEAFARRLDLLEERRIKFRKRGVKSHLRLAQVLKEMGSLYAEQQELDERQLAISYFVEAINLFREMGEKLEEADVLRRLGEVYYWINEYIQARECIEAAQLIFSDIGDRLMEANCIMSLGNVHLIVAEYHQARERYDAALPIFREVSDRLGEANCIKRLGDAHRFLAEYPQARERYGAALDIFREISDRIGEANCIMSLGDVHRLLADFLQARDHFETALSIFREIDVKIGEANCIMRLGDIHRLLSEYHKARECHQAALTIFHEIGTRLGEANCIMSLGDVHLKAAEYNQARIRYEAARLIFREIGDRLGEANCIKSLGHIHRMLTEYPQARMRYEAARLIFREIGDRLGEANTLIGLEKVCFEQGEEELGIELIKEAVDLYSNIGLSNLARRASKRLMEMQS